MLLLILNKVVIVTQILKQLVSDQITIETNIGTDPNALPISNFFLVAMAIKSKIKWLSFDSVTFKLVTQFKFIGPQALLTITGT